MLATRLAREQGFDEALLITPHDRVFDAPGPTTAQVARDVAARIRERLLADGAR